MGVRRESDGSGIRESLIQALSSRRFFVLTDEEKGESEAGDEPGQVDEEDDWTDDTDEEDWATSLAEAGPSSPPSGREGEEEEDAEQEAEAEQEREPAQVKHDVAEGS